MCKKISKNKKSFLFFVFLFSYLIPFFATNFYWENPQSITNVDSRFPQVISTSDKKINYVIWEEIDEKNKQIYLSLRCYESNENFSQNDFYENLRFAGPFIFSGDDIPDIFSCATLEDGTLCVSALSGISGGTSKISVFTSNNKGRSFITKELSSSQNMVAPRVYKTYSNEFRIFATVGIENAFTIYSSTSKNGIDWSNFIKFKPTENHQNPFIPVLISHNNCDIVVFQSQYILPNSNRFSYQLFLTSKTDKENWSEPVLLTNENSLLKKDNRQFFEYQNQRPFLYSNGNSLYISWEKTLDVNSDIWFAEIQNNSIIQKSVQQISNKGNATRGIIFEYKKNLYITWFDTRRGKESIYWAEKQGEIWTENVLEENENTNMFVYPLIQKSLDNDELLSFIWQEKRNNKNKIAILLQDKTVGKVSIKPLSFNLNQKTKNPDVKVQLSFPNDSSNIAGYSYSWSIDKEISPKTQISNFAKDDIIKIKATENGTNFLKVKIVDYAGNWSEDSIIEFLYDIEPPLPPYFDEQNFILQDEYGFSLSNNFSVNWKNSLSDDVAGYSYRLDFVANIPKSLQTSKKHPLKISEEEINYLVHQLKDKNKNELEKKRKISPKIMTENLHSGIFYNLKNGIYVFSVSAIDKVGNISEPKSKLLILNKFEPSTYIQTVEENQKDSGDIFLTIYGGGFTYDGKISEIYIDLDGKPPYNKTLKLNQNEFQINSDNKISQINLGDELDEGVYKIGLLHQDRGLYFSNKSLKIEQNGTVKIEGEYLQKKHFSYDFYKPKISLQISIIILIIILIIFLLILIIFIFVFSKSLMEKRLVSKEIKSLIYGGDMPLSQKKQKQRLPSIKRKLITFTFGLVICIAVSISIQNGIKTIDLQATTLSQGLQNRIDVLLESVCSGVKNFLPANNLLELTSLPSQKDAMSEIQFITIVGQNQDSQIKDELNNIWASNDPDLDSKMDTYELSYGKSKLLDENIELITKNLLDLDKKIAQSLDELSNQINQLSKTASSLYSSTKQEDLDEAERLSNVIAELRNKMDKELLQFAKQNSGSYPKFDSTNFDFKNTKYIFYRPVIYRQSNSENFIHALVYFDVSTQTLIDSINQEIYKILRFAFLVAVLAVLIGVFGAYFFASIIVRPIKKLEKHVIMIGHTKNKINLKGKDVEIKSKDEIGRLGNAINNMTHELVSNAEEEALTMDGKAVQNAFLPLKNVGVREKSTISEFTDENVSCYGYYEGESGVSGDYFDYKKLDKNWFVIIKCDASGHGIPAAIIMTVVAVIFRRYFNQWTYEKNGTKINKLVEQINDFIEELGLKGKFATLIICLLNNKTGELFMCNAGDNLVRIFDNETKTLKTITLNSAPTAGVFTSDLISMRGGFTVEKTILKKGDTLLLYTDGIEESNRKIRNLDYSEKKIKVEIKKLNPKTGNEEIEYKEDDAKEEFGPERIKSIVECVYNKKLYVLSKEDNPNQTEKLEFDFTKCNGTPEEVILALSSIEKVFRLYKTPNVAQTDYIKVDKKIDEFLQKYFNMYDFYATNKSGDNTSSLYVDYDKMLEDEQSDDLTLLAVKRL